MEEDDDDDDNPDDDDVEYLFAILDEYVPLVVCGVYKLPLVDEVDLLGEITGILCV